MARFPDLMTVAEVADAFQVTDETVHRWCRDGRLPYILLPSGTKRFRRAEIDSMIEAILRGEEPSEAGVA